VSQPERDEAVDEERGHVLDVDSIFGVRVVRDADPEAHARRLEDELGAEIVRDGEHAQRAFTARAEAGRTQPVVLDEAERAELGTRAAANNENDDDNDDSNAGTPVDEATIVELQQLAGELAMTERIRSDTEAGMTESLNRRLSATSAVAIHPSSIRQAAAAVTDTEAEIDRCDEEIAALGERPTADLPRNDNASATEQPSHRDLRTVPLAIGVALLFAVAAIVLFVAGVFVLVPIAVLAIGVVVAVVLIGRSRGASPPSEAPEPSNAAITEDEWIARRAQIDAARQGATERLRSARRHWESLVGADADPHQVDDVLRVRDPQLELVGAASKQSPTVRTVNAVHRRIRARWRVAWAAVGYDDPPELDDVATELERLRGSAGAAAHAARGRLRAADAWTEAGAAIDRPIVLVEPSGWLPAETLETMVHSLPAGAEVIVVEREDPARGAES